MKNVVRKICFVLAFAALGLFFVKDCQAQMYDYERMSSAFVNMLDAATNYLADNFEVINTNKAKVGEPLPKGELYSYKGINPEGFASMVGKEFAKKTGITIKFVSQGKDKLGPRSGYNKPDKWEAEQLKKFTKIQYPKGVGYGEVELVSDYNMVYRYIYPLYIEHKCLQCHGDPKRSPTGDGKDITGFPMENFKLGELSGAISLTFPIE